MGGTAWKFIQIRALSAHFRANVPHPYVAGNFEEGMPGKDQQRCASKLMAFVCWAEFDVKRQS